MGERGTRINLTFQHSGEDIYCKVKPEFSLPSIQTIVKNVKDAVLAVSA